MADIYRVDRTNGSSWGNATGSVGDPWKYVADVQTEDQGPGFNPGDRIEFKDDEVWPYTDQQSFYFESSGTVASPIVFTRSGDGSNRPELNMKMDMAGNPDYQTYDGLHLNGSNLTNQTNGIDNANGNGVNTGLVFKNIYMKHFGNMVSLTRVQTIEIASFTNGSNIYNSGININGYSTAGHAQNPKDGIIRDCVLDLTDSPTGNDGISLHEGDETPDVAMVGSGWLIYNNHVTNCAENALDITAGNDVLVFNNYVGSSGEIELHNDHSAYDVHYFGNYVNAEVNCISLLCSKIFAYNNVFVGGTEQIFYIDNANTSERGVSFEMINNTCVVRGGQSVARWEKNGTGEGYINDFVKCLFKNNIYTTNGSVMPDIYNFALLDGEGIDWDVGSFISSYNILHDPSEGPTCLSESGSSLSSTTWATVHTTDLFGDPGLIDRTDPSEANLAPVNSSALCYGAGLAITTGDYYLNDGTATTGIDDDYNGSAVLSPPTIGAIGGVGSVASGGNGSGGSETTSYTARIESGDVWNMEDGDSLEMETGETIHIDVDFSIDGTFDPQALSALQNAYDVLGYSDLGVSFLEEAGPMRT